MIIPDNGLTNLYLKVIFDAQRWPERIEAYTTMHAAQKGGTEGLVTDDIVFDSLPVSTQDALIAKMDEIEFERVSA